MRGGGVHTPEQVVDAGEGLYAAELEHPPDEHLYRQQHIAVPCRQRGEHHNDERNPCIEDVGARYVLVVARYHVPLPQR